MERQAARDAQLPGGLEELEPPLSGDEPAYAVGCDLMTGQRYAQDLASWAVDGSPQTSPAELQEQVTP